MFFDQLEKKNWKRENIFIAVRKKSVVTITTHNSWKLNHLYQQKIDWVKDKKKINPEQKEKKKNEKTKIYVHFEYIYFCQNRIHTKTAHTHKYKARSLSAIQQCFEKQYILLEAIFQKTWLGFVFIKFSSSPGLWCAYSILL